MDGIGGEIVIDGKYAGKGSHMSYNYHGGELLSRDTSS